MKRKPSISHDQAIVRELRDSPEFAKEYLQAAMEDTDEPKVLLIALRHLAEARGGIAKVAKRRHQARKLVPCPFPARESAIINFIRRGEGDRAQINRRASGLTGCSALRLPQLLSAT